METKKATDIQKISTMALLRNIPQSAPGALEVIAEELIRREKLFREKVEGALKEIEEDERLGYPIATVDVNAPLALIQCALQHQVRALKYVLMSLDVKDGEE